MNTPLNRRSFCRLSTSAAVVGLLSGRGLGQDQRDFRIALSERSLDRSLSRKTLTHLDLAATARTKFGINAVTYASQYFGGPARFEELLTEMNKRAANHGVRQVLIGVSDAGRLADPDKNVRKTAVDKHRRWVDAAKYLGCHAISVDVLGDGDGAEQLRAATDGVGTLAEIAAEERINVLIANHAGLCTNPVWVARLVEAVDSSFCGTHPGFAGFGHTDRYDGLSTLMPFAKGVCATAQRFDENGEETSIDFARMVEIVLDAGYRGYISIDYRGKQLDDFAGIRATKKLLERIRDRQKSTR